MVWDGAPSHRSGVVQEAGFALVQQPAYEPELDPVERLFEELRRVVEGKGMTPWTRKWQPLRPSFGSGMPTPSGCADWWAGHGPWKPLTSSLAHKHMWHDYIELV